MIAIDFGAGSALAMYGPDGAVSLKSLGIPPVKGGRTDSQKFIMILSHFFNLGEDVVTESPTVGSSGCEVADVERVLDETGGTLWTLSARAVKNYRMDHGLKNPKYDTAPKDPLRADTHKEDAEILYTIATESSERLRRWHLPEVAPREYTSVRPMDKRGYRDERSDEFMSLLPDPMTLPAELANVVAPFGKGKIKTRQYRRSLVMPFAMALAEPWWKEVPREKRRKRFFKILGAYDHGYPSFYRRMTVTWMQGVAKDMAAVQAGLERVSIKDVSRATRKEAQKITQRQMRQLFHFATCD